MACSGLEWGRRSEASNKGRVFSRIFFSRNSLAILVYVAAYRNVDLMNVLPFP